MSVAVKEQV